MKKSFKSKNGNLILPIFFPDATKAVLRTLDSKDLLDTRTEGILVNTWHLYRELGARVLKAHGGIREFMGFDGAVISDSGGFQVMSVIKSGAVQGKVTDEGVSFKDNRGKELFTPEKSIQFQMQLQPDMVVVLDDFTDLTASEDKARETVERTIKWAQRSKDEFEKICEQQKIPQDKRPYLLGVVQGGNYLDLRKECTQRLVEIGFDGLGYGGWPIKEDKTFNYDIAKVIAKNAPDDYLLYGLGIGMPEEIVECVNLGWQIFDCVLPTRDARHKRLYVYNASSIDGIDVQSADFYKFYTPDKERYYSDTTPVSSACDCLLCKNYTRAYLAHLFRIEEVTAQRLATIHNLRFYSILMEKLKKVKVRNYWRF